MAASASIALKAGVWFRRARLLMPRTSQPLNIHMKIGFVSPSQQSLITFQIMFNQNEGIRLRGHVGKMRAVCPEIVIT